MAGKLTVYYAWRSVPFALGTDALKWRALNYIDTAVLRDTRTQQVYDLFHNPTSEVLDVLFTSD